MPISKPDFNLIFASQAPSQDLPAAFNNYARGWDEARKNNGKPTIKQFNYLIQQLDLKALWMIQNGAALPFDSTVDYAEGALTLKDGELQQFVGGVWKKPTQTADQIFDESGDTQQQVNDSLKSSVFYHIDNLEDAQKYLGYIVEYNGKHFKVSTEQSKDIRHPVIRSGSMYLIPYDHTTLSFKVGSLTNVGTAESSEYYRPVGNPVGSKAQQGFLIDNANKRAFITTCFVDASLRDSRVLEYDFTDGVLGALLASGTLPMGHADYFAMTVRDGVRTIWFYRPSSGQWGVGGHICGATWVDGATATDIHTTIAVSSALPYNGVIFLNNHDNETLSARGDVNYFISIEELYNGRIVENQARRAFTWGAENVAIVATTQQIGGIVDVCYSTSGTMISDANSCFYAASDVVGEDYTYYNLYKSDAARNDEIEGLGFWWNSVTLQFEPVLTTHEWYASKVHIYNLSSNLQNITSTFKSYAYAPLVGVAQSHTGKNTCVELPSVLSASKGLMVGGVEPYEALGNNHDPRKFIIDQWSSGAHNGRYGARLGYDLTRIWMDGQADSAYPSGFRFLTETKDTVQFTRYGINIGHTREKSVEQRAEIDVRTDTQPAVYATAYANKASFVAYSGSLHYGTVNDEMYFGKYDADLKVNSRWLRFTATAVNPMSDGNYSIGTSELRFNRVFCKGLNAYSASDFPAAVGWSSTEEIPAFNAVAQKVDYASQGVDLKFGLYTLATKTSIRLLNLSESSLYPQVSTSLDLGSATKKYKKGWLNNLNLGALPVYADNAAAVSGGLVVGDVYRTGTGQLMIVY